MTTIRETTILEKAFLYYLSSGDFNGLGTDHLKSAEDIEAIKNLIMSGALDLVRGDGHQNPHIKAFPADSIGEQIGKIERDGVEGCLYPTPNLLVERNAGASENAPYTRALKEGAPQLSHRCFDLRALEWYRNDPRFEFMNDDITGRIMQKKDTQIEGRAVALDGLEFLEFGFAYNDAMHRAIAAFVRYLHDLPEEQQIEMKKFELEGVYRLHPDFYRTSILGEFPERISIYDAFLLERVEVNRICNMIGGVPLFRSEYDNFSRPDGFGILLRPTRKEYRDFALLLDQLLSDDMNQKFFENDIKTYKILTDEEGASVKSPKGTILLLEEWLRVKFRVAEQEPVNEMFAGLRAVRKERQAPAHKVESNSFDQKYVEQQRKLIILAFDAVRTLRMLLENHPAARGHEVSDYLREAKVWTM